MFGPSAFTPPAARSERHGLKAGVSHERTGFPVWFCFWSGRSAAPVTAVPGIDLC